MRRMPWIVAALALVAGCSDSTAPESSLSPEDVRALAAQIDGLAGPYLVDTQVGGLASLSSAGVPREGSVSWGVTHPCPLGGSVRGEGTLTVRSDLAARDFSLELSAEQVHQDCGVRLREGSIALTGAPALELDASLAVEGGEVVGPQETTLTGAVSWVRGDSNGTCGVSLTSLADFQAMATTLTGTLCGEPISQTRHWGPGA